MTAAVQFTNKGRTRFWLIPKKGGLLVLVGGDDDGEYFHLTIDRVWAANLHMELGDYLSGDTP